MLCSLSASLFERSQFIEPLAKSPRSLGQTIPRESSVLHLVTRKLHIVAREAWIHRAPPPLICCGAGGFGGRLNFP